MSLFDEMGDVYAHVHRLTGLTQPHIGYLARRYGLPGLGDSATVVIVLYLYEKMLEEIVAMQAQETADV